MKKTLLLFTLSLALFTLNTNAQDKTWNFTDAAWTTPSLYAGYSSSSPASTEIDGLTLISGGSNVGVVTASAVAYANPPFAAEDVFTSVNVMTKGSATVSGFVPSKRALSFPVTGACKVKVWVSTSSTGRVLSVSDGSALLASWSSAGTPASPYRTVLSATYTATTPGIIYIYTNNTMSISRISLTYTPLGTDDFKAESFVDVYANGNQVFVSNVKSATTVAVYTVSGALVKTVEATADTNFELGSGVYVAKVKSAEGEKSVKLLVK